jgi:hypothetical protein
LLPAVACVCPRFPNHIQPWVASSAISATCPLPGQKPRKQAPEPML